MLISRKHNFIFIHIYKNAGTSIVSALRPFDAQGRLGQLINQASKKINIPSPFFDPQPFHDHITASEMIDALGKELFDSFFSFAFVRNPWDWQVSLYKFMLKDTDHYQHELVKNLGSFEEYIKWRCENEVRYQKDFIYSEKNELLIDFVGKFENIDADFKKICSHIRVTATLPKLNVSNTEPYQQFYTDKTRDLVRRIYKPDIELFEYDF